MRRALLVLVSLSIALAMPASASAANVFQSGLAADALAATGLVAAYSMDQGSGTSLPDVSGTGNNGAISGATWAATGKFGSALSFNGSSNIVTVPDSASLDLTTGMTTEAWVQPGTLAGNWRTVLFKQRTGGGMVYDLYANGTPSENRPTAELNIGGDKTVAGTAMLATGVWTHLAATYDGAVLALYVNGAHVARSVSSARCHSTGRPADRRQHDLGRVLQRPHRRGARLQPRPARHGDPDRHEPVGQLPRHRRRRRRRRTSAHRRDYTTIATSTGRPRPTPSASRSYRLYRSTSAGFTPRSANRSRSPRDDVHLHAASTSRAQTTTGSTADGGDGNVCAAADAATRRPATYTRRLRRHADRDRRDRPGERSRGAPRPTTSASSRYNVHRGTTPASRRGPRTGSRSRPARATPTRRGAGTYFYKVTAEDPAGNVGPASNEASATVTADTTAPTARRLDRDGGSAAGRRCPGPQRPTTSASRLQRPPLDDARLHAERRRTGSRSRPARATRTPGLAADDLLLQGHRGGPGGQRRPALERGQRRRTTLRPSGLVAAYGFDEGTGTTTADASGHGNTGTLGEATSGRLGKFGTAPLRRRQRRVTSPTRASLDLTTGMTLEAWVLPTLDAAGAPWSSRSSPATSSTGCTRARHATSRRRRCSERRDHELRGPSSCPSAPGPPRGDLRRHTLRLYVNGAQVASRGGRPATSSASPARCGSAATTSGPSSSTAGSTRCASTTAR